MELEVDADQLDAAAGLLQLTTVVQGLYARISERHELTPVQVAPPPRVKFTR